MATLEELRRERDRLKSQREVRESFAQRNREKKQLQSEIRKEKHLKLYKFGNSLGQISAKVGNAAAGYIKKKSVASKKISKRRTSRRIPKQRYPTSLSQSLYGKGY